MSRFFWFPCEVQFTFVYCLLSRFPSFHIDRRKFWKKIVKKLLSLMKLNVLRFIRWNMLVFDFTYFSSQVGQSTERRCLTSKTFNGPVPFVLSPPRLAQTFQVFDFLNLTKSWFSYSNFFTSNVYTIFDFDEKSPGSRGR